MEFWERVLGAICSTEIWSTDFDYGPGKYESKINLLKKSNQKVKKQFIKEL